GVDEGAEQAEGQGQHEEQQAEADDLGQAGAGQPQPAAPGEAVVLRAKPVAADVAAELEVARVDDVVATVGAVALPEPGHAGDAGGAAAAEPGAAAAAPGLFEVPAEAAAGLGAVNGGGDEGRGGGFGSGHTQSIASRRGAGYGFDEGLRVVPG